MDPMADFDRVLCDCGVTKGMLPLSAAEALDRDGYTVLPQVLGDQRLEQLRRAFEDEMAVPARGDVRSSGTRHIESFDWRHREFDEVFVEPLVLAAVAHVLRRRFRLLLLGGRDPLQGYGQQGMHTDWLPQQPGRPHAVVTALWFLDDSGVGNGATRVVPGSHLSPRPLPKACRAPRAKCPGERPVEVSAGDIIVFNGHLWHSGTRNVNGALRRAIQCQYVASDAAPPAMERAVPDRLSAAARALLGF